MKMSKKEGFPMKQTHTRLLKLAIILISLPVIAAVGIGGYQLVNHPFNADYAYLLYPIVGGICLTVLPFFFALFKSFQLLIYIDNNQAFQTIAVKALKQIKRAACTISFLYVIILPLIFMVAERDDAPGLILVGMMPVFASFIVAVFAALLEKLLAQAIAIKLENDLTV